MHLFLTMMEMLPFNFFTYSKQCGIIKGADFNAPAFWIPQVMTSNIWLFTEYAA